MKRELQGISAPEGLDPHLRGTASVADEGDRSAIGRQARRSMQTGQTGYELKPAQPIFRSHSEPGGSRCD